MNQIASQKRRTLWLGLGKVHKKVTRLLLLLVREGNEDDRENIDMRMWCR